MIVELALDQIIQIHDDQIKDHGGLEGIKEPGLLESLSKRPFSRYFGEEQYPGLFLKAAVYWEGLATGHFFNDANKRTSVMVMLVFLDMNGIELDVDPEILFEMALRVAKRNIDLYDLAVWIENQC
jgi:death on curing protein